MKINQSVLDEIRSQANRQSKRNYKCIEIDVRLALALVQEVERHRLVDLRFDRLPETVAELSDGKGM